MYKYSPSCRSTNIKKNGHTYYGKQNHRCKCCGRQFVLNNQHTKSNALKKLIQLALKERISLRGICRIFGISLTWLQSYAHILWKQTPRNLGLTSSTIHQIKKLQVFGIQVDEMWSFVRKKQKKRWIWIAYDPIHRLIIAHHIEGRGTKAARKFWKKIPDVLKNCFFFETDDWKAYKKNPQQKHKIGKDLTYYIEGVNITIRARVSRLVRKTLSFSKVDKWHNLAIQLRSTALHLIHRQNI